MGIANKDLNDRENDKFRDSSDGSTVVAVYPIGGLNIDEYDYVGVTATTSSETYTFKRNGSSGTVVATVVLQYTDSTKELLSSVTKT